MMKMLDLFSGLGGASEAFVNSNKWEVQRIENNPILSGVPHTTISCVKELRDELQTMVERGLTPTEPIELLWASPPCLEFSLAYSAPQSIANREGREYSPDMSLLEATMDIIEILQPRYWVIENVRGAAKHFAPYLGEQKQVVNHSIFLWGNYPSFQPGTIESKFKHDLQHGDPLRANVRAIIPIEISRELRKAVECQTSLFEFV